MEKNSLPAEPPAKAATDRSSEETQMMPAITEPRLKVAAETDLVGAFRPTRQDR